ncbi:MAG: peptidase M22 [Alicyclobacillus sp.]|nr:peptidase M22 [Alicyclobacillus sp.]
MDGETGAVVAEHRLLLPVQHGERGLRQSDALFFHVQRLPTVVDHVVAAVTRQVPERGQLAWRAVGASVRPRPAAASYMPVFTAGTQFAETFARLLGIPMVRTSHQEGHLAAADRTLDLDPAKPFLAVHLSGGTSDVLWAQRTSVGYRIVQLGSSSDLNAGQFVDRVGVEMGLGFPAGPALEAMAEAVHHQTVLRFPASVRRADMSFSGPCTAALRALRAGWAREEVAAAVFACVANSVVKAVQSAAATRPDAQACVLAGGVMANRWLRARILHRLRVVCPGLTVRFAPVRYASDNAVGVAAITQRWWLQPAPRF